METWPPLRKDLQFYRAPEKRDRESSWMLYDPLRSLYIELGELELLILRCWHLGSPAAIAKKLSRERRCDIRTEQVEEFRRFATDNDLLQSSGSELQQRAAGRAQPPLKAMQQWVFWRRPLFSPNRLSHWLAPLARLTGRRFFWLAMLALAALVTWSIGQHWIDYLTHLRASWNPAGIGFFVLTFFTLSLFHELGHSSVARLYGIRANSVGIGLIALMPIMYSEITDAWRLPQKARLHISCAGVAFEVIAGLAAAIAWILLEDGPLRSAAFFLFTSSLITTLLINLNPLMRFDGYYLLGDYTGEKNLHQTSATLLRTAAWNLLLKNPSRPRSGEQKKRERLLVAFGLFSLLYRLAVFTVISWMAYQLLFKAAGVVVFFFCIAVLLLVPTFREIAAFLRHLRGRQQAACADGDENGNRENRIMHLFQHFRLLPLIFLALLLAVFLLPLPWPVQLPASTYFAAKQQVLAPAGGLLSSIAVEPGDRVVAGQPLLQLENDELDYRIQRNRLELQLLRARMNSDGFSSALDSLDAVYLQDLLSKERELQSLQAQKAQLRLTAQNSGLVDWRLPGIGRGEYLSLNQPVLSIVDPRSLRGRAYGRAQNVERIRERAHGRLFLSGHWRPVAASIEIIDDIGSHKLDDPALAELYGGPLRAGDKGERIDEARHRVEFSLAETQRPALTGQRIGHLVVFGEPVSLLQLISHRVAGVFVRESGI